MARAAAFPHPVPPNPRRRPPVREKLDAWLSDGGTIRIVPIGAFGVAVLLGVIPMWLEFGSFPRWAPRERVGGPLLVAWIIIFLAAEVVRRYWARRGARTWEKQLADTALEQADDLAGVIDRLCAPLLPGAIGHVAPDQIHAALLQGFISVARESAGIAPRVKLHASLLVPEIRREGKRQVHYLRIVASNRLAERRGWASFRLDAQGPAQDTYRDGNARVVPDTETPGVRTVFKGKSFRSIVTLPVTLGCLGGKRLAVVSIDASEAGIVTDEVVRRRRRRTPN